MHVMHRFLARACAVAAVGVALGTWGVTAASASAGGRATIHHGARGPAGIAAGGGALRLTHDDHAVGRSANAPTNNRMFAGYETTVRRGSATVVAASFTVPTLSCTTARRAIAPDAGVAISSTKASFAFVITACANGKPKYIPGLVLNGKGFPSTTPIAAGDVIDLTTKVSTTRTKVELTDVTTGVTLKRRGVGASARAAFIGDDAAFSNSGTLLHVPDFGKLTFTNCLVDGTAFGGLHPQAFQRVNSRGTVQISTGGFFPSGTAFSTHFKHS
jgi:hypothetical protein